MKLSGAVIKTDFNVLLTVWELRNGHWEILSIIRLRNAITRARESPTTRLVFPTGVKPHGVWSGSYKHRIPKTNSKKVDSLQQRQESVLTRLEQSPGQTREVIASRLEVSVATTGQLLRKLEKSGDIHRCPHPYQNKTKLYYVGTPTTTGTSANKNITKPVPSAPREPPLKIYFIDPRTLQPLNQ